MTTVIDAAQREQLLERREKLRSAASSAPHAQITRLLGEVDAALARTDAGTYGLCEACHGAIEPERLLADPLVDRCLDHLLRGRSGRSTKTSSWPRSSSATCCRGAAVTRARGESLTTTNPRGR